MKKSILSLNPSELRFIMESGTLPDTVSLEGIEERDDFEKLYKLRNKPSLLARHILLKSKQIGDSLLKEQRIELQKGTLKLKTEKLQRETERYKGLKAQLSRIETKQDYTNTLLGQILTIIQKED